MAKINNKIISDYFCRPRENSKHSSLNHLSTILYKNSCQKYRIDLSNNDDSLTSLNWLNNINIAMPSSDHIFDERQSYGRAGPGLNEGSQQTFNITNSPLLQHFPNKLQSALRSEGLFDPLIRYEYKSSWSSKPPFSYTTLICMAMLELYKPKIALYEIYEWIRDNFLFYRISDSSWQNSVRHNLSLKKCFEKVPRRKDERGKGGFWRINANYTENLGTNLIKYRRQFQIYASPQNCFNQFHGNSSNQSQNSSSENSTKSGRTADDYTAFSKRYSTITNTSRIQKPSEKLNSLSTKSVFKKPITLSSLNQYKTIEENDNVISQIRLDLNSPTLYSLTEESLLSDISHSNSSYSNFGFDDFDSTSSSFDTDFSCSSILHTSSEDSYPFQFSLDFDDFPANL